MVAWFKIILNDKFILNTFDLRDDFSGRYRRIEVQYLTNQEYIIVNNVWERK
jgi:hypothetical protein